MLPIPNTSSSTTTVEGAPSPLFHIPWPFLDDIDEELFMSHLLSQHHMNNIAPVPTTAPAGERGEVVYVTNGVDSPTTTTARPNMVKEGDKKRKHGIAKKQQQPKKKKSPPSNKTGKKDRHSKICTAQGIRDRRMRLSLKVARKFFDLQDMLGFDKASKTIEWLLIHCKAAIQELTPLNAPCNNHISNVESEESQVESEAKEVGEESGKRKRRKSRKVASNHLARESRDKARARARERTKEKLMRIRGPYPKANPQISKHDSGPQAQAQAGADLFEEPRAVMDELLRSSSSSTFSYNSPDFAAALSGSSHNLPEPRIEPAPGCYAITSKKPSLGNLQVQNIPNAIFTTAQIYDGGQWNPSSVLLAQENPFPNSILMTNGHLQGILASPLLTPTTSNATFQSSGKANHFL